MNISAIRYAKYVVLTAVMIVMSVSSIFAEVATLEESQLVCRNWLNYMVYHQGGWAGSVAPEVQAVQDITVNDTVIARYFEISPSGYILVPILKELPPVKVSSEEYRLDFSELDGPTALFKEVIMHRLRLFVERYGSMEASQPEKGDLLLGREHRLEWDRFAISEEAFIGELNSQTKEKVDEFGPLLTTAWHQQDPYNQYCPMGDGGRCVVGCVATAAAQILAYHQWPPEGTGSRMYYWSGDNSCGGSTPGQTLEADYSDPYDWENIPTHCPGGGCTPEQQAALAELNYEVGVAFSMDYGRCGSGAYTASALNVFPQYFRFIDTLVKTDRAGQPLMVWSDLIRDEMEAGRPAQYRISGHSIVCDGWRMVDVSHQVHMNYGWGGSNNYWYTIDNLYCNWDGCSPMVEFIITRMIPDKGVMFRVDTAWGQIPLEIEFTGISELEVDSWTWDFGDGDSDFVQSPKHTYTSPDRYDITVQVDAGGDIRSYHAAKYITALADTIIGYDLQGNPGDTVEFVIYVNNTVPLRRLKIPIEYSGSMDPALVGYSAEGCRTDYFDQQKRILHDPVNRQACFSLYLTDDGKPDLEPGAGPVLKLYFAIPGNATYGQTASIKFDDFPLYELIFCGPVVDYPPLYTNGEISLAYVCGDANYDGTTNILDVTYLTNYLYRGGPSPIPLQAGDVDSGGSINLLDVTAIINFLYKGGPELNCP